MPVKAREKADDITEGLLIVIEPVKVISFAVGHPLFLKCEQPRVLSTRKAALNITRFQGASMSAGHPTNMCLTCGKSFTRRRKPKQAYCSLSCRKSRLKHGGASKSGRTPEYVAWVNMRCRCYYPRNNRFHLYGDRGITVCDRWRNSFEVFLADMGLKPTPRHSLDRIDNNGNYEPDNCHWVTPKEQSRNTRRNLLITCHDRTMPLVAWADETGIKPGTISARLQRGWAAERALATPISLQNSNPVTGSTTFSKMGM